MSAAPLSIVLVNMPFAAAELPSLGLTQLRAVVTQRFPGRVSVRTLYLNLDFVGYLGGLTRYRYPLSQEGQLTGIGDWFFRQAAFPEAPDNTEEYVARFYFETDARTTALTRWIVEKRAGLERFLDALIERHALAEADLVGFTSMFAQNTASIALARKLKERTPRIVTVMGGSACEGIASVDLSRRVEPIDYFFSGPALVSFPEFVRCRLEGQPERDRSIRGVFARGGPACEPAGAARIGEDLDINTPIDLDYDDFLDAFESTFPDHPTGPALLFETSRGCRWGEKRPCAFCGLNGLCMRYRAQSPDLALRQFQRLFRYASRSSFLIGCDNLMPANYPRDVFTHISPPAGMSIRYEVRPDLRASDLRLMSRAGVRVVQPGIESLATSSLKRLRKGVTAFTNLRFLLDCLACGVTPEWNLLIGIPGEDEGVYAKTLADIPRLAHLPPPAAAFPVEFVRFSHYFDHAEEYGLALRPHDFCGLTYPFEERALRNIARRFVDDNVDQERLNAWLDRLNGRIRWWHDRWLNRDHRHPAQLLLLTEGADGCVQDTRSGEVVRHVLSPLAGALLRRLATPADADSLAAACGADPASARAELERLAQRGLLFREDGRYLSLLAGGHALAREKNACIRRGNGVPK